jgi:hypothetical protein
VRAPPDPSPSDGRKLERSPALCRARRALLARPRSPTYVSLRSHTRTIGTPSVVSVCHVVARVTAPPSSPFSRKARGCSHPVRREAAARRISVRAECPSTSACRPARAFRSPGAPDAEMRLTNLCQFTCLVPVPASRWFPFGHGGCPPASRRVRLFSRQRDLASAGRTTLSLHPARTLSSREGAC